MEDFFSEGSHRIETHLDVVKEVLEIYSSASFEFCLDEEHIKFWWVNIMFEGIHTPILVECPPSNGGAILLLRTTTVGSGGVYVSFWAGEDFGMLVWSIMNVAKVLSVSLISFHLIFHLLFDVYHIRFHLLFFFIDLSFHEDELVFILVLHIFGSFWNIEVWHMNSSITEIQQWLLFVAIWRRWKLMNR